MRCLHVGAVSLLLLSGPVTGQLGAPTGEAFNAQAAVTNALGGTWDGIHGAIHTLSGTYWVSARRSAPTPLLRLLEFSDAGAYLSSVDLPAALSGSATGLLDLAFDIAGNAVYGSCEHAVAGRQLWAFRPLSRLFDVTSNIPIPAAAPGNAARGVAYNRFGNGGQGTFFCVDGTSAITEFTRAGNLVRLLSHPHPDATALAVDDTQQLLWVFGPGGSTSMGEGVVGVAIDLVTGLPNGQKVLGDPSYAGTPRGGTITGAEFTTYKHDHTVDRLVLVTNASSDWVYQLEGRFALGSRCGGAIGFSGDAAYAGNAAWTVTLRNSVAANALLLLTLNQVTTPIGGPLFVSACHIHLGLAPAPLLLGGSAVSAGNAQLALPIPSGVSGSIYLQWIEVPAGASPLRASNGGGVFVRL